MNEQIFVLNSQKKTTNHILHLILTVLTGGLWTIVWIIVASKNSSHNKAIQGEMMRVLSYKAQGMNDVEAYKQGIEDRSREIKNKRNAVLVIAGAVLVYIIIYLTKN